MPAPFKAPTALPSLSPSWHFEGSFDFPGPSSVSHLPPRGPVGKGVEDTNWNSELERAEDAPPDITDIIWGSREVGATWIQEGGFRTCQSFTVIPGRALSISLDGNQHGEFPGLPCQDAHLCTISLCMTDCSRKHLFILWLSWLLIGPIQRYLCLMCPQNQAS